MEVYLGRQPILDRGWNIAGYGLLCSSSQANSRNSTDDVSGAFQAVATAMLGGTLDRLLGDKPAFINFDRTLLLGERTILLPPEKVVIEIPESVQPEPEILSACQRLREEGYALALQTREDDKRTIVFSSFVDILKVDFQQTSPTDQERMISRYQQLKIRMMAAKVGTETEFMRASDLGFHYFQGTFFAGPVALETTRVPASQTGGFRLVKLIQNEDIDFESVEQAIRFDISFAHSLLTYVNSAAFDWSGRIESVRQALLLLGGDGVRKWAWMASLSTLGEDRPPVLVAQVLMRGRFCEAIAGMTSVRRGDADPFLIGMFSLLDAILWRPLEGILEEMNVGPNIRKALLDAPDEENPLALVLGIVKSYELGDFTRVDAAAQTLGLSPDELSAAYLQSLTWVETVFSHDEKRWRAAQPSGLAGFRRDAEGKPQPAMSIA